MTTENWAGKSGATYTYNIFPIDESFPEMPGNYIFARGNGDTWTALYIGETGNLKNRLGPQHEKWDCVIQNGATHIHAHASLPSESTRKLEEQDLIDQYSQVC